MIQKQILIIEDDVDIRDSLRDLLEMEGMRVLLAADGREGLKQLELGSEIDVILLDLMMPVMNGWEFLEKMKANPSWAGIPVIAVSAAGSKVTQIGANAFLRKPLDLPNLLQTIETLSAGSAGCASE